VRNKKKAFKETAFASEMNYTIIAGSEVMEGNSTLVLDNG
jgi:type III restriction enzyme